jgi:hypothetical protein
MAWPKRGTRKIRIEGEDFLWHYDACPCCSRDVITVGREGAPFVLFIDPYPNDFPLRPGSVASAIKWARAQGWSPESGPTRPLALDENTGAFVWLRPEQRHLVG